MANASSSTTTTPAPTKRKKVTNHNQLLDDDQEPLLPGLPDHIAQLCLSLIHPTPSLLLYSVCHSWRRLIYSPSFPPFFSLYALLQYSNSIQFFTFDPISSTWDLLPPPPPLGLLLHHPSFISRNLPIQSLSVSQNLILLAATTHNLAPALSHPLIFNPVSKTWTFGPPLVTPRRWCAAGTVRGAVYVASGMGSHFSNHTARLVEKWDFIEKNWKKKGGLKDGRFSREAIDAVGWRGKLCMVNVKGDTAAKEGVVYDVEKDVWEEMPKGMLRGWRGPVAAMDEDVMYVVDEGKGFLRKYNEEKDAWEEIMESERLRGAQHMAAASGGKLCVVCGGGGIVVVDVVASPRRLWRLDMPMGFEAVRVHILPRMTRLDFGVPVLASTSSTSME
uniref:F-box domain-containing protein n=1 Tax=Fagus sylvatica TaxID=28930 RepID=A0A2N9GUG6_FAGSY